MEKEDISCLILELCSVGSELDKEDVAHLHKTCGVIEEMTSAKCFRLIREAGTRPVLQTYMSDGWTTDVRATDTSFAGKTRITRKGRLRTEFALERCIVKARLGDHPVQAIKIARPRPMLAKKCIDFWSASCEFMPMLKLQGHQGISLSVYLQDGLFSSCFGKRMISRHKLFFEPAHCPLRLSQSERHLAELRDWCFYFCCVSHIASRALKWALKPWVVDKDFLEHIHVSISALVRASTALHREVLPFLKSYVAADSVSPPSKAELEWFWTFLDVDHIMLELFVSVNPRWDGERLRVRPSVLHDDSWVEKVSACIKYCLRWTDLSETRWGGIGPCSRMFCRSLIVGVEQLVKQAQANDAVMNWHLNGFNRASLEVRQYLCIAAGCARPSEAVIEELFEDDRFLMRSQECWASANDELTYLLGSPWSFWCCLAAVVHLSPGDLRRRTIDCCVTSIGFMWLEIWLPIERGPLRLAMGDCAAHVEALKSSEPSSDYTIAKVQVLAQLGYDEEVVSALILLKETPMSTTLVEQAHGSGAQLMRRHPTYEMNTLISRATVHNARSLFHLSQLEKRQQKLQLMLENVEWASKQVNKCGAREAFLKLFIESLKGSLGTKGNSGKAVRKACFSKHATVFKNLDAAQKDVCKRKALTIRRQKRDDLAEQRDLIMSELSILELRRRHLQLVSAPTHLDSCRFDEHDFSRFSELWSQYTRADYIKGLKAPPARPPHDVESLIQAEVDKMKHVSKAEPEWLKNVIDNTELFAGCCIYNEDGSPMPWVVYRVTLCIQNPRRVCFLECRRRPRVFPNVSALPLGIQPDLGPFVFEFMPLNFLDALQVPLVDDDSLSVGTDMHPGVFICLVNHIQNSYEHSIIPLLYIQLRIVSS